MLVQGEGSHCEVHSGDSCLEHCCGADHGSLHTSSVQIIHTRETKGVSLWMHITFAVGVAFWFTLGVMLWNWPMMLANAVTFMLTVVIVIMKLKYR